VPEPAADPALDLEPTGELGVRLSHCEGDGGAGSSERLLGGASVSGTTVAAALGAKEELGFGAGVNVAAESTDVGLEEEAEGITVSVEASVSAAVEENIKEFRRCAVAGEDMNKGE